MIKILLLTYFFGKSIVKFKYTKIGNNLKE